LFIAEPPLYRVDDKHNPFVINKSDYVQRYVKSVLKEYNISKSILKNDIEFYNIKNKNDLEELKDILEETSSYVDDLELVANHYKINDRLLELILEELSEDSLFNIDRLIIKIQEEFPEIYYDDKDNLLKGPIDGKYQLIEISDSLINKSKGLIELIRKYKPKNRKGFILKNIKTGSEEELSLLQSLKILRKYQPNILHRFKGLGENNPDDLKTTIMDPNTRTLIRVKIDDIVNDMKTFQILRGNSPLDAKNRKQMMYEFKIDRNDIDT
jgi:DNA gyrase/topoisomerase IV subunit B